MSVHIICTGAYVSTCIHAVVAVILHISVYTQGIEHVCKYMCTPHVHVCVVCMLVTPQNIVSELAPLSIFVHVYLPVTGCVFKTSWLL